MDLINLNRPSRTIDDFNEAVYLRIALMYTNQVCSYSFFSGVLIHWYNKDKWEDNYVCSLYELVYKNQCKPGETHEFYKQLKEARNTKNKNKAQIVNQQQLEQLMKIMRNDVHKWFTNIIERFNLVSVLQFFELSMKIYREEQAKGIHPDKSEPFPLMLIICKAYNEDSTGEDPLIKEIVDTLLEFGQNIIFDEVIEKLVPFKRLDEHEVSVNEPFFFSSYLFEFPNLHELNYEQLKYVRDELKSTFEVFHQDYAKLVKELVEIPFENAEQQIQLLLNTHIRPHLEGIQKKIDENIYIQQQKNRYGEGQRIKVVLGVSSVENQIALLEKEGMILPFVADAIIGKLEKSLNVKSCVPFVYHKLPILNAM